MIGKPMYMSPSATTAGGGVVTDTNPTFSFAIDGDEPITGYTINILPQEPNELPDTIIKGFEAQPNAISYKGFSCIKNNQSIIFTLSLQFNGLFKLLYTQGSFQGKKRVKFTLGIDNLSYVLAGQHIDPYQSSAYFLLSPNGQQAKNGYDFTPIITIEKDVSDNNTIEFTDEILNFTYTFDFSQHNTVRTSKGKNACYNSYAYFANISYSSDRKVLFGTNGTKNGVLRRAEFYYTSGQGLSKLVIGDYKLFIIQNKTEKAFVGNDLIGINALVTLDNPQVIPVPQGGNLKDSKGNLKFFTYTPQVSLVNGKAYRWYIDKILDSNGEDVQRTSKTETFVYQSAIEYNFNFKLPTIKIDESAILKNIQSLTVYYNEKTYQVQSPNDFILQLPILEEEIYKESTAKVEIEYKDFQKKKAEVSPHYEQGSNRPEPFDKLDENVNTIKSINHLYCKLNNPLETSEVIRFIEGEGTVINSKYYDYCYYPNREMYYYNGKDKIIPSTYDDFWGYSLLLCNKKDATGYKVQKVYDFQLNINVPSYTNNAQYTTLKNFTPYPFIENTSADYLTGDCQGLIGLVADDCMTYIQKPEILNELAADLIDDKYVKLLKMPEGRMLRIQPTSGLSAENNDTHDFKKIKFSWAEIEDVTNGIVYGEKEVSAANGKI